MNKGKGTDMCLGARVRQGMATLPLVTHWKGEDKMRMRRKKRKYKLVIIQ